MNLDINLIYLIGGSIAIIIVVIILLVIQSKSTKKQKSQFSEEQEKLLTHFSETLKSDNNISLYNLLGKRVGQFNFAQINNNKRMIKSFWMGIFTFIVVELIVVYSFLFAERNLEEIQTVVAIISTLISALILKFYNDAFKRDKYFLDYFKNYEKLLLAIELVRNKDIPEQTKNKLYDSIIDSLLNTLEK